MNLIQKYFENLSSEQIEKFEKLLPLYTEWNNKINVISRKDMDSFYERHVLHSLGIASFITFKDNTKIIDVGTGGGFPGIPLAIFFPNVQFTLIDSIGKKIKVVENIIEELDLKNAKAFQKRSDEHKEKYDFVVSRAVSDMTVFFKSTQHLISKEQKNAIPNGIISLKGGDLTQELKPFGKRIVTENLYNTFQLPFFETKKIIHLIY